MSSLQKCKSAKPSSDKKVALWTKITTKIFAQFNYFLYNFAMLLKGNKKESSSHRKIFSRPTRKF